MELSKRDLPEGCYIDLSYGSFVLQRIIEVATIFGFPYSERLEHLLYYFETRDETPNELREIKEYAKWALDYLNDEIAPAGLAFGLEGLELFLWPVEEWVKEQPRGVEDMIYLPHVPAPDHYRIDEDTSTWEIIDDE